MQPFCFFALFFLSGIAGLIYESIWTHYLKLFLGHAAYAQTLVLAIYMGGMAAGAWIAGSRLQSKSGLLIRYAIIEILLGAAALLFHDLFLFYQKFSFTTVLPILDNTVSVFIYKWLTSALIILPQSMLLGATFPYMAAGFIRRFPVAGGYKIAALYFANTLGASIGVLLAGFFLIGKTGLKGTIVTAGCIDLFVGGAVILLCTFIKTAEKQAVSVDAPNPEERLDRDPAQPHDAAMNYLPLLIISGATAASSFMYEIGWIRMLSLVLGSSTHSFELMLSAFIFGIALGSFFIRKKIDRIANIPRALVLAQVIMGIGALFSIFTYSRMFHLMQFFMAALSHTGHGYFFFNLFADVICMLVMLPSTICAGMVLPLIIHLFYRNGHGEAMIGKVYSINTLGGIAGIVVSVWLLMPLIGVRLLVTLGGVIDIALGFYMLYFFKENSGSSLKRMLPATCIVLLAFSVSFGRIDPALAACGVFRNGTIGGDTRIVSHKDGRTATVSLYRNYDNLVLSTNGKPDAAVNVRGGIGGDEYTMALTGVLPLATKENGSRAAVIGMGSGMTAHYLLYDSTLAAVDIIEIEPEMVRAARLIGEKTANAFTDKRAHIYIDDAKTFLSTRNNTYDIIVSEPSNPWVSGVSGLFSREFFGRIKNHLADDGILVQWFHRYESDISIFTSIFKALREYFPNCRLYFAGSDCIVIASKNDTADLRLKRNVFSIRPLAQRLGAMGFESLDDLTALCFSSEKTVNCLIDLFSAPPNSDYAPYVDLNAVKYRFIDDNIKLLDTLRSYIIPVRKIIESDTVYLPFALRKKVPDLSSLEQFIEAKKLYHEIVTDRPDSATSAAEVSRYTLLLEYVRLAPYKVNLDTYFSIIFELLERTLPYLSVAEMRDIWNRISRNTMEMRLSEDDRLWMFYFGALCSYNMPLLHSLSAELLPQTGGIEDDEVNRMLLTSLMVSASSLDSLPAAETFYKRYDGKDDPGIMLRLARSWGGNRP